MRYATPVAPILRTLNLYTPPAYTSRGTQLPAARPDNNPMVTLTTRSNMSEGTLNNEAIPRL